VPRAGVFFFGAVRDGRHPFPFGIFFQRLRCLVGGVMFFHRGESGRRLFGWLRLLVGGSSHRGGGGRPLFYSHWPRFLVGGAHRGESTPQSFIDFKHHFL